MKTKIFTNTAKTECVDYTTLKLLHKNSKEESLTYFREKAVGANLKEYEQKIVDEIAKKYLQYKSKCLSLYETACSKTIQKDVEQIEANIR